MSSDGHHLGVMKGKSRAFWIVLAGVVLANVCDATCLSSYKDYFNNNLLKDHWYLMKLYNRTGEEVTVEHEFLSVLNLLCSSINANEEFHDYSSPQDMGQREKIVWIYVQMVENLIPSNISAKPFCRDHSWPKSYSKSFLTITQFLNMYSKVCEQDRKVPACPSPQSTTAAVSLTTTSPAPERTTTALSRTTTSPAPEQQKTSSESSNVTETPTGTYGRIHGQKESQHFLTYLVVSMVMNVILLFLLVITGLYIRKIRRESQFQASVHPGTWLLQNVKTASDTQSSSSAPCLGCTGNGSQNSSS